MPTSGLPAKEDILAFVDRAHQQGDDMSRSSFAGVA